jgi:hypothetical protein
VLPLEFSLVEGSSIDMAGVDEIKISAQNNLFKSENIPDLLVINIQAI